MLLKQALSRKNVNRARQKIWERRLEEMKRTGLSAYDGHDTVGMVALDSSRKMVAGTSSSGLFMKNLAGLVIHHSQVPAFMWIVRLEGLQQQDLVKI